MGSKSIIPATEAICYNEGQGLIHRMARGPHVIGVGQPEERVEPVVHGQVLRMVTQVPLADTGRAAAYFSK